jgi:small redox-active disulfide protein 2
MKIQVFGSGCHNCQTLAKNAEAAARNMGIDATVEKVTDSDAIMEMGVMVTPGLAVDGELKSTGTVLSTEQIQEHLRT